MAKPSMMKLSATKEASTTWFSWMWLKIKSSPMNVGVMGKPDNPKQQTKNKKAATGCSYTWP
jgi:hypothetical protein